MLTRAFRARIHREGDAYIAICEETGALSRGHTLGEALANLGGSAEPYVAGHSRARAPVMVTVTTYEVEAPDANGNGDADENEGGSAASS